MKSYKLAIVGATGVVGRTALKVLEEKNLPISEYVLFASKRSCGTKLHFMGKNYEVRELTETSFDEGFDFAIFSAGGDTAKKFAPIAASKGCIVVDNSSAFRMEKDVPLVVPEVNPEEIKNHRGIIANPNCSTIQAVVPLKPLDIFLENGYTKEEEKMINETRKILKRPDLKITATTVRVPVFNSHSESINVEFEKDFDLEELVLTLKNAPNVIVQDDVKNNIYPLATNATGHDEVFVGRIRRDKSVKSGVNLWIVADNIRKGAASNAIQIVEKLIDFDNN